MILCCPVCQSTEVYEVIGGYGGHEYRCKHCGYRGALIVEIDEEDLREALLERDSENTVKEDDETKDDEKLT